MRLVKTSLTKTFAAMTVFSRLPFGLEIMTYAILFSLLLNACMSGGNSEQAANGARTLDDTSLKNAHSTSVSDTGLISQYIRAIFQDSKGNYWFGPLGTGPIRYDGTVLTDFQLQDFYQGQFVDDDHGSSVHSIEEDRDGNIWFGTFQGVIKYDGVKFKRYAQKDGLSNIQVGRKCILVDSKGTIWVGTSAGVYTYDSMADKNGEGGFSQFELMPAIQVIGVMEDKAGNIWFATSEQGVYKYDRKNTEQVIGIAEVGPGYAGSMAQDDQGNYWFTTESGVCKYDGHSCQIYTSKDGIGGSEVWGLYIERSGIIWITSRGSTTRFDPSLKESDANRWRVFTPKDGLNCCVQSMYQDKEGNMWWGAGSGVYRFDGLRFYQVKRNGPWK